MRALHAILVVGASIAACAVPVPAVPSAELPTPYLVKEINTETTIGTNPSHMVAVGDALFFVTGGWPDPPVLWKTGGTAAGTVRVADVGPVWNPIAFRDELVFGNGEGLWASDGTAAGTRLIAPIVSWETAGDSSPITVQAETLFLVGCRVADTCGLWSSDGTPDGTMLVKAMERAWPETQEITSLRGTLVLLHGQGLWTSDGTAEGTRQIVAAGTDGRYPDAGRLANIGDLALFTSCDGTQCQLWRTDGTDGGTFAVATLVGRYDDDDWQPRFYTRVLRPAAPGGILFVCSEDDLWSSDGTVEGTRHLASAECGSERAELAEVRDVVIFRSCDGETGCEPWRSDGTPAGTGRLLDLEPGPPDSDVQVLGNAGGAAFFTASTVGGGTELWRTDGTPAGTIAVSQVPTVGLVEYDDGLRRPAVGTLGETLFFAGCTAAIGCELWKSDGTAQGTGLVRDITPNPPSADSSPGNFVDVGGALHFTACEPTTGCEIWRSDGTEKGTSLVADIEPGAGSPGVQYLTDAAGTLYFTKSESLHCTPAYCSVSSSLWKSDGTPAGTVRIFGPDTDPGWQANALASAGGMVFFLGRPEGSAYPLWRSDGTAEGTIRLTSVQPYYLTGVGDTAFFAASDGVTGFELWASDGTPAGTTRVADINPEGSALDVSRWGWSDPPPRGLLVPGDGVVYFPAYQPGSGCQVWRSDGTAGGTVRLTALAGGGCPSRLTPVNGTVFFVHSSGLWRTDGSAPATVRLAPYSLPYSVSTSLPVVGNTVFFTVCSELVCALWRSDGTPAGTRRIFAPGVQSEWVSDAMQVGDTIVFSTWDRPRWGPVLWQSDGTESGTAPVLFIPHDGYSPQWTPIGPRLFFTQADAEHGRELWAIPFAAREDPPEPVTTSTTTSTTLVPATSTTTTRATATSTTLPMSPSSPQTPCAPGGCDDDDPCTVDRCDEKDGCVFVLDGSADIGCRRRLAEKTAGCAPPMLSKRFRRQLAGLLACAPSALEQPGWRRRVKMFRRTVAKALRRDTISRACADALRGLVPGSC